MVRLKLRTCSTKGISMKSSRLAQAVTSHSLIIVREFALMQAISEPFPDSVKQMRAAKIGQHAAHAPACRDASLRSADQTGRADVVGKEQDRRIQWEKSCLAFRYHWMDLSPIKMMTHHWYSHGWEARGNISMKSWAMRSTTVVQ